MITPDLISLITPCYNTAHLIGNLLDSVLAQDYPKVQMIIIDDGSTDNCKEVINSYTDRFNKKGYELEYHYQSNHGQSYAVKHGLQYAKGEFLAWPDSDDFYSTPQSLRLLSDALKKSDSEFRLVRGKAVFVDEFTLQPIYSLKGNDKNNKIEDFEDCLFARNGFYFPPIAYMTYTETILNLTNGEFFCSKNAGQNWQLMLPVLWNYRLKNIEDQVCCILERSASHSRGQFKGRNGEIIKNEVYEKTLHETIKKIQELSLSQQNHYHNLIKKKYYILATIINYSNRNRRAFKKLYLAWDKDSFGKRPFKFRLKYYSSILHIENLIEFIFNRILK